MRLNRFIGDFDLNQRLITVADENFLNQTKNVLRFKVGDEMILCDGKMNEANARFVELGISASKLEILNVYKNENEPKNNITLYCPILKKENFELAIQKAVEIGVKEIVPIITSRTVKLGLNNERLNKIIKEAAEQSGRGILPKLHEAMDFNTAIERASANNYLNLFFNIGETPLPSRVRHSVSNTNIGVFVGPEGGWTDEEIKTARSRSFVLAGLGKTVLRAETAAITASYLSVGLNFA